jgi:hypothetical protein
MSIPTYPFDYTPPYEGPEQYDDGTPMEYLFPKAGGDTAWERRRTAQSVMGILDALGMIRVVHPDTNGWYLAQEVRPPSQQPVFCLVLRATHPPAKHRHPGEGMQIAFHNFRGFSDSTHTHLPDVLQWQYLPDYPTGVKRNERE